jgi:hypothetical protein
MKVYTPDRIATHDLPAIIAAEFDEQPGLRLTFPQVKRLWDLSPEQCQHVLEYLIFEGKLVLDEDGRYCRPACTRFY